MKTTLHYYRYDLTKPDDAEAYKALTASLKAQGLRLFASISTSHGVHYQTHIKPLDGQQITLETKHLFNNQWNTAPTATSDKGLRVFDWAEGIYHYNRKIKEGQWLEQTPQMREIRRNTLKCGYCGRQEPAAKGLTFCPHCLGSEHLLEKDLFLLRLQPIAQEDQTHPELTTSEAARLLPLYWKAQGLGKQARDAATHSRNRQRVAGLIPGAVAKGEQLLEVARIETEAYTWLLDRGVNILDNVIYYTHTGRFCFGWRTPLPTEEKSDLKTALADFPFDYDLK